MLEVRSPSLDIHKFPSISSVWFLMLSKSVFSYGYPLFLASPRKYYSALRSIFFFPPFFPFPFFDLNRHRFLSLTLATVPLRLSCKYVAHFFCQDTCNSFGSFQYSLSQYIKFFSNIRLSFSLSHSTCEALPEHIMDSFLEIFLYTLRSCQS